MLDINSTPEDILAVAIDRLNTGLSFAAGSTVALHYFAAAEAAAAVANAAAALIPVARVEYLDGYVDGADSEVDLVVNLDGTTEPGISLDEAVTRQALEAEEADALAEVVGVIRSKGDDLAIEDVIEPSPEAFEQTATFLRAAVGEAEALRAGEAEADDIDEDFGAPAASPVFAEALAEQKAGAKKKGKKS